MGTRGWQLTAIALGVVALIAVVVAWLPRSPTEPPLSAQRDLLIAYETLADTLSDESNLKWLVLLKQITFDRPDRAVEELMQRISDSANRRADELEELRELPPDVSMRPDAMGAIGDAITTVAKEVGTAELRDSESFGLRFVVLQTQATRMVAAIATAAAQVEKQPRRKAWLESLASEYEGLREELLELLDLSRRQ